MNPADCGLPHRAPFVFVDDVTEIVPGESARGLKTFAPEEAFFRGHFPDDPLVPGVILTEALAQIAGIAAGRPGSRLRLAAIRSMKFLRPVRALQEIVLVAVKSGEAGGLLQFSVTASVEGMPVVEGAVVLSDSNAG